MTMKNYLSFKQGLLSILFVFLGLAVSFAVEITVNFTNSDGDPVEGASVQTYDYINNGWAVFGTTDANGQVIGDVTPNPNNLGAFRLLYNGNLARIVQDIIADNTVDFNSYLVTLEFINSNGDEIDCDNARYQNFGGWYTFGDGSGNETIELIGGTFNLEVSYEGFKNTASKTIESDTTITFQTANLSLYFTGDIQISNGGWQDFNAVSHELLPNVYHFRFFGDGYSNIDRSLQLTLEGIEKSVSYVKFVDSEGNGIEGASTQSMSSPWIAGSATNSLGSALNFSEGYVSTLTSRVYYGGANEDLTQDNTLNSFYDFSTISVSMDLLSSLGNSLASDDASYFANGWRAFGDGETSESIEMLAQTYLFKVEYAGGENSKYQDVSLDQEVIFNTVNASVMLKDSQGNELTSTNVIYKSDNDWHQFGDGLTPVSTELLAQDYTFRILYAGAYMNQDQDISVNESVSYTTVPVTMNVYDQIGNSLIGNSAQYYFSEWLTFSSGNTPAVMELLPVNYDFSVDYDESTLSTSSIDVAILPNVSFEIGETPLLLDLVNDELEFFEMEFNTDGIDNLTDFNSIEINNNLSSKSINAFPNPFSERVKFNYEVKNEGLVSVMIHDISGNLVSVIKNGNQKQGFYQLSWNGTNDTGLSMPSGVYILSLNLDGKSENHTIILEK